MQKYIPRYDFKRNYSTAKFASHDLQTLMALFLAQPELYETQIANVLPVDRQGMFFNRFQLFIDPYMKLNLDKDFDELMYFSNLSLDKAGSANITGGGGTRSGSGRRDLINKYKETQDLIAKTREYFSGKYKLDFNPAKEDPRVFLGHHEPWNKASPALLEKEGWEWVVEKQYNDLTMSESIPENVNIVLVPLVIRNKVSQHLEKISREKHDKIVRENKLKAEKLLREEEENENKKTVGEVVVEENVQKVVVDKELEALLEEDW